jgi:hypothetical protein
MAPPQSAVAIVLLRLASGMAICERRRLGAAMKAFAIL